ncbi:MAG: CDP-alcohol phosphatidyltransferase family protein [bacterium]
MFRITLREVKDFKYRVNPEERQGSYGYYFMRRLSLIVTWLLLNLGLSANQVTLLQIISGILGCVFFAFPKTEFLLLGVLFMQLGFLFDNVDGEIARFQKQVSMTGKYLDTIGHEIVVPFMFFGLAVGCYFRTGNLEVIIFGFLAGLFALRLDIATLYLEAGQMLESQLQKSFDYYSDFKKQGIGSQTKLRLYRLKNEASLSRMIFALFAYPGIMNIFSLAIFVQIFVSDFRILNHRMEILYILILGYGTILPIRRIYTIWKLVSNRETERKYLQFKEKRNSLTIDVADKTSVS